MPWTALTAKLQTNSIDAGAAQEQLQAVVQPLLRWYAQNARDLPWRHEVTPYRVWVSEIMLQQTRVEAVKGYFQRFLAALPDIPALAAAPQEQLLKLWEGLGYYSRARNLQKAAQVLVSDYAGALPADDKALLALPGIGSYTAGAIASIAFHLPVPAVDGNVLRVLARLRADSANILDPAVKKRAEALLAPLMPGARSGTFNQALMELGATVCVPNAPPRCAQCPVSALCRARQQGCAAQLPYRAPRKPRRVEQRTVFLLEQAGKVALRRRPAKGLLASLWELPGVPGWLEQEQAVDALRALGVEPLRLLPLPPAKHVFTHVEWQMHAWRAQVALPLPESCSLQWAMPEELAQTYALPSAFRPFLPRAGGLPGES